MASLRKFTASFLASQKSMQTNFLAWQTKFTDDFSASHKRVQTFPPISVSGKHKNVLK